MKTDLDRLLGTKHAEICTKKGLPVEAGRLSMGRFKKDIDKKLYADGLHLKNSL